MLRGVGKVYAQVVVGTICSLGFAKVHTSKMPITARELLHQRVLSPSFYEDLGNEVGAVLTDGGRQACDKPDSHPCELLLVREGIDHPPPRVCSPQTNSFVERMNRTLLDDCSRVEGRKAWYQGPAQALREFLGREESPRVVPQKEEEDQEDAP